MKKIILSAFICMITFGVFAQAPNKVGYQAIVRDTSGQLIKNKEVGIQISILQGSASGNSVYTETHAPSTNVNGLVSIEIGDGEVVSGDFSTIDWSAGPYFVKTETDPEGGFNYAITGTSQLLSVPYAIHASSADEFTGELVETDPTFQTSPAAEITSSDLEKWNNPEETDPVFSQSAASEIIAAGSRRVITPSERAKLQTLKPEAEENVQANWNETDPESDAYIANKPDLSGSEETDPLFKESAASDIDNAGSGSVITTAERTKLSGVATGAEVNVQANWTETDDESDAYIANKPKLFTSDNELDPVFAESAAHGISSSDITNWNGKASLPSQSGNNGKFLTTNGTSLSWATTGSSQSAFGYCFATLNNSNYAVAGGADVPFTNNGPLSGVTHTAGTATITVPHTGTYAIDYSVSFTSGVGAAIAIAVNGIVDASTNKNVLTSTGEVSGTALLTLSAGNVLTLRNNSATPLSLDMSPGIGAQIKIRFED